MHWRIPYLFHLKFVPSPSLSLLFPPSLPPPSLPPSSAYSDAGGIHWDSELHLAVLFSSIVIGNESLQSFFRRSTLFTDLWNRMEPWSAYAQWLAFMEVITNRLKAAYVRNKKDDGEKLLLNEMGSFGLIFFSLITEEGNFPWIKFTLIKSNAHLHIHDLEICPYYTSVTGIDGTLLPSCLDLSFIVKDRLYY